MVGEFPKTAGNIWIANCTKFFKNFVKSAQKEKSGKGFPLYSCSVMEITSAFSATGKKYMWRVGIS